MLFLAACFRKFKKIEFPVDGGPGGGQPLFLKTLPTLPGNEVQSVSHTVTVYRLAYTKPKDRFVRNGLDLWPTSILSETMFGIAECQTRWLKRKKSQLCGRIPP